MVKLLKDLGPQAYFVNFPSGFLKDAREADGSFEAVLGYGARRKSM